MLNNPGKKIKSLARAILFVGIISSIISGIALTIDSGDFRGFLIAVGIIIGGIGASWVTALFLSGFGQLVDNSDKNIEFQRILLNHYGVAGFDKVDPESDEEYKNALESLSWKNSFSHSHNNKTDKPENITWKNSIAKLSNEEIIERLNSDEWTEEYKNYCTQELRRRNITL